MWNKVLDEVFRKKNKSEYEKYKKALEHMIKVLTKVLENDDAVEIIVFGEFFEKALKIKKKSDE